MWLARVVVNNLDDSSVPHVVKINDTVIRFGDSVTNGGVNYDTTWHRTDITVSLWSDRVFSFNLDDPDW